MNASEIKLDLFRRIDNLPKEELEILYSKFLALINANSEYQLSSKEKKAIDEAFDESKKGNVHAQENVVAEAKQKYPNLNFE